VKEALANGRLAARGAGQDAVALAAALARPWADVVLSGAATVAQLESNLAARELAWNDALEERLGGLVEEPAAYWATRAELPWN
jgi:aryl-alcohol dehydrogenase-like predicted oxidoreductase